MKTAILLILASLLLSSCTAFPTPYGYGIALGGTGAAKFKMDGEPVYAPQKKP